MDGINEAADTHRYLRRLHEDWAPLYQDISIEKVQTMLPGLLSAVRTMQTVCRWVRLLVVLYLPRVLSLISLQAVVSRLHVIDMNAKPSLQCSGRLYGKTIMKHILTEEAPPEELGSPPRCRDSCGGVCIPVDSIWPDPSLNISQWRRFYTAPEPLTNFLQSITMQLISSCRARISAPGKIWDQHKPPLISNLCAAVNLRDAYLSSFRCSQVLHNIWCSADIYSIWNRLFTSKYNLIII